MFLTGVAILALTVPIIYPVSLTLGIDPIHLGILFALAVEMGGVIPPVGLNLFVTSGVAGMPMMRVVKSAMPWLGILFVFLILITYVPWFSTFLPTAFLGPETVTR